MSSETRFEASELDCTALREDDLLTLALNGDFDVYSAPQVKEYLLEQLDEGVRRIIVDLRECTFIDSSGLGILCGIYRRVNEFEKVEGTKTRMCLAGAQGSAATTLLVTGLDKHFQTVQTMDEAIAYINK